VGVISDKGHIRNKEEAAASNAAASSALEYNIGDTMSGDFISAFGAAIFL
jgi:hypothetical protein